MIDFALKIAERSPHKKFGVGCVLAKKNEILSVGWSHPTIRLTLFSCHAEQHALYRCDLNKLIGATAYVATISKKSGNQTNSRPCKDCVKVLAAAGIAVVRYTLPDGEAELDLQTCMEEEFKNYHRRVVWGSM